LASLDNHTTRQRQKTIKYYLHSPRYEEKAELYNKIFATADVIHARNSGIEHHGPVGIDRINTAIDKTEKKEIDFSNLLSGIHIIPIYAYSSTLENMKLLKTMLFTTCRNESIHIATEKRKQLPCAFGKNWNRVIPTDQRCNLTKKFGKKKEIGKYLGGKRWISLRLF
jgi:hypothetical protein